MTLYQKLCRSSLDIRDLGFIPDPRDSILGTTSDGEINFCIRQGCGTTIFATGEETIPVAKNFTDFLGLLYACKDARLISKIPNWTRLRFQREYRRISLTHKQHMIRNALQNCFQMPIIRDPYGYIQSLQPAATKPNGTPTSPLLQVSAAYGDTKWHAKELCSHDTGLDVQLCVEIPGQRILDFYDRWEGICPDAQQLLVKNAQDPFAMHLSLSGMINGTEQKPEILESVRWDPLSDPTLDAKERLLRYELDKEQGWIFLKLRFQRQAKKKKPVRSLVLNLESEAVTIPGAELVTPTDCNTLILRNPITGNTHKLTIHSCTDEGLDPNFLINPPCFYTKLCYNLTPALGTDAFRIFDPLPNDRLRTPPGDSSPYPDEEYENAPTEALVEPDETLPAHIRTAYSARHYEQPSRVQWQTRFCGKLAADAVLPIIR